MNLGHQQSAAAERVDVIQNFFHGTGSYAGTVADIVQQMFQFVAGGLAVAACHGTDEIFQQGTVGFRLPKAEGGHALLIGDNSAVLLGKIDILRRDMAVLRAESGQQVAEGGGQTLDVRHGQTVVEPADDAHIFRRKPVGLYDMVQIRLRHLPIAERTQGNQIGRIFQGNNRHYIIEVQRAFDDHDVSFVAHLPGMGQGGVEIFARHDHVAESPVNFVQIPVGRAEVPGVNVKGIRQNLPDKGKAFPERHIDLHMLSSPILFCKFFI